MLTRELDYELPEELIAQKSAVPRDSSRLMVVDVGERTIRHRVFRDLPRFLGPGDTLVVNETKVLPARVVVRRPGGGASELLFLRSLAVKEDIWEVLARPSRRLRAGMVLSTGGDELRVVKPLEEGRPPRSRGSTRRCTPARRAPPPLRPPGSTSPKGCWGRWRGLGRGSRALPSTS